MLKDIGRTLVLLFLLGISVPVQAVMVQDLFEVSAPHEQSVSKEQFFKESLEQVLVRLTGEPRISQDRAVQRLLSNAERFVQKYSLADAAWWVQFDESRLLEKLEADSIPYLSYHRPLALAWVAIENYQGQRKVIDASNASVLSIVDEINENLAMSVTLPLMDLEDVSQVSVTDLHPNFASRLNGASMRYGADVWLAAKIEERTPGQWVMEWMIQTPTRSRVFKDLKADTSDRLLQQALETLGPIIVEDYGIAAGRSLKQFKVQIQDVKTLEEYAHVMNYLRELDVVTQAKLEASEGDTLTISLETLGGEAALSQSVRLDHQLIAQGSGQFRWSP